MSVALTIISGSEDGLVRIWDLNGRCIRTLVDDKEMGIVSGLVVATDTVTVFTMDSRARVWKIDGRAGQSLVGHKNKSFWAAGCLIHGARSIVCCGSEDGRVVGWDLSTGKVVIDQECGSGVIFGVDVTEDKEEGGLIVATGGADGWVRIWHLPEDF